MGTLKWYKRDPRAALIGMMGLTLEETGCYCKLLELIYCHDGALADGDIGYICRTLNCDPRTWRRLKARLLNLGKIYMHAGTIRNERADDETTQAQTRVRDSKIAASKRWATYNEIKGLSDARAMLPTATYRKLSANIVPITPPPRGRPSK
jgi:hypothetical protein